MTSIGGVWNLDAHPVDEGVLAGVVSGGRPREVSLWTEGAAGLGAATTPNRRIVPLLGPGGEVCLFDGRLDERERLISALGVLPEADELDPDAAMVLAAYAMWGEDFVEHLEGDFALAVFDPRRQWLVLARDPMGTRPLHYARARDLFVFSGTVAGVLAHPRVPARVREDVLARHLLQAPSRNRDLSATFFEGVSTVEPGCVVILTPDRLRARRYWDFDGMARVRLASVQAYADAFRTQFDVAVRRRLVGTAGISVAPGGDLPAASIAGVLAFLQGGGEPLPAVRAVSEPIAGDLIEEARRSVTASEAPIFDAAWVVRTSLAAQEGGGSRFLSAYGADRSLFSTGYLSDLADRFALRDLRGHLHAMAGWVVDASERELRASALRSVLSAHVPAVLERPVETVGNRVLPPGRDAPWFEEGFRSRGLRGSKGPRRPRVRFATEHGRALVDSLASPELAGALDRRSKIADAAGLEVSWPFLDRDLIAFLVAVPGDVVVHQGVPGAILREAMAGDIPERIRLAPVRVGPPPAPVARVDADWRPIAQLLMDGGRAASAGYVDRRSLEAELPFLRERIDSGDTGAAAAVLDLVALELWLEAIEQPPFVAGTRSPLP